MIILDTNVLSEIVKATPLPELLAWIGGQSHSSLYTTSISKAELLYGIELLPMGKRRSALYAPIERILAEDFAGRILPFDSVAAELYGRIAVSRRGIGRPISDADAQIAAIVFAHRATLATRNIRDFTHCGIELVNPWHR